MRTVYDQPCRNLYKVDDPVLFFHALSKAVQSLRYMKRAGYLHGNVNPGNYFVYYLKEELPSLEEASTTKREDWVTVLSDLEYSRPFLGSLGRDPITSDPYYIAVEVQSRTYQFKPRRKSFRDGPRSPALKCFAFNPYHDLESSLWMALEFVIRRAPQKVIDGTVSGRSGKEILQEHAKRMFVPEAEGSPSRWDYLTDDEVMETLDSDLRLIYGVTHPVLKLVDCLLALRDAYLALENSMATVRLDNGRDAFQPNLFKDAVYASLEAAYRAISDHYACADRADTFLWVPKPPGSVFHPFCGGTEGSDVDGSSVEDLGEGMDEGLPKGDRASPAAAPGQHSGGEDDGMHAGDSGLVERAAFETGADMDGVASGSARAASSKKRKPDNAIQPELAIPKAKRPRVKGAAPARSSDRIRSKMAEKAVTQKRRSAVENDTHRATQVDPSW